MWSWLYCIGTCRATEEANKLSVSIQLAHDLVALLGKRADFTGVSVAVSCGRLPVTKVYNSTVWSCMYWRKAKHWHSNDGLSTAVVPHIAGCHWVPPPISLLHNTLCFVWGFPPACTLVYVVRSWMGGVCGVIIGDITWWVCVIIFPGVIAAMSLVTSSWERHDLAFRY